MTLSRMDELRRLIQGQMEKQGLSYREAAGRAKGLISYAHLSVIVNGGHSGEINDKTLTGIALAIDVPVSRVRKAYGTTATEPISFGLPDKAKHLSPKQRKAVLAMVDAFLDGKNGK